MMEPSIFCLHAHTNLCSLSLWGFGGLCSLWGSGELFSLWGSGGLLSLGVWGRNPLSLVVVSSLLVRFYLSCVCMVDAYGVHVRALH